MKTCARCGNANADEMSFCGYCGTPLNHDAVAGRPKANPWKLAFLAMVGILLITGAAVASWKLLPDRKLKLSVGNEWVYAISEPGGNNTEVRDATLTVTGVSADKSDTYNLTMSFPDRPHARSLSVRCTDDAIMLNDIENETIDQPAMLVKYPLKNGAEWDFTPEKGFSMAFKVEGEETLEVPAGKFKCYKIQGAAKNQRDRATIWFNKSAGYVKFEAWEERDGVHKSMFLAELKKFGQVDPAAAKRLQASAGDARSRATCIMNQRNVQQAVRSYANINGLSPGDPFDWSNIIGTGQFIETMPTCPAHGKYQLKDKIPAVGTLAMECSLGAAPEGHEPQDHQDW